MHGAVPIGFNDLVNLLTQEAKPINGKVSEVPLSEAVGQILAEDLIAVADMPAFTNSAMDGYAWRSKDFDQLSPNSATEAPIFATVTAGHPLTETAPKQSVIRIMTGAPLPEGFDTVLPIEAAHVECGALHFIPSATKPLTNVRTQGELYRRGSVLLKAGTRLSIDAIGLAASNGCGKLACRVLRAAVFASGDELVEPEIDRAPVAGKVYNSNGIVVTLLLKTWGVKVDYLGILPDSPEEIERKFNDILPHYDLVVCSGGVGPGEHDFTAQILSRFGQMQHFHVAMKPGKPFTYARLQSPQPVFFVGLPGNPVATNTAARFLLSEVVARLLGTAHQEHRERVLLKNLVKSKPGRTDFLRAKLLRSSDNQTYAQVLPLQSSATLLSCAQSDAILVVDDAVSEIAEESPVWVYRVTL